MCSRVRCLASCRTCARRSPMHASGWRAASSWHSPSGASTRRALSRYRWFSSKARAALPAANGAACSAGARATPAILLLVIGALPLASFAQNDPKREMAEVLKAPEFGYEQEVMRWVPRGSFSISAPDFSFANWLAKLAQYVLWALVAAALAY